MPKIQLTCEECGSKYERWPSQVEGSRFCRRTCLQAWMDREVRPNHKAPWLRKFNEDETHQENAGRSSAKKRKREAEIRKRGGRTHYRKKGGVHEHRRVAERVAGRPLKSSEIVHHIDEDSWNNDPANLVIGVTRSWHAWVHTQLKKEVRPKVLSIRKRKGRIAGMKYKFKTRPYRHQVKALKKLVLRRGGALFMEMGTGKTKVVIDFCCAMYMKTGADTVVIVCPKSVISVWKLEIKKHAPEKIRERIRWIVINYDQLPDREVKGTTYLGRMHVLKKLLGSKKSILVADESHIMKRPSAKRSKAMYQMGKEADHRVIMTGTKLTKDVLDLYQQFKFLDDRVYGTNFNDFKRRYCVFGGYGNYKLLRYINLHDLKEKARPYVFQVKKSDCLDLPSRTDQIVPIKLTGEGKELYDEMAKEGLVTVNGHEIDADIILTKILRLQQISSGFLPTEDGIEWFGDDKARQLEGDLAQFREQERLKGVIFCQFTADLKKCAEIAKRAGYNILLFHGDVSVADREARLCEFDETKEPTMFITQIDAGSLGISLTAASDAFMYSHSRKFATTAQAKDRLHRIGQHHPVTYRWYIAPGVDQAIYMGHRAKKNVEDLVLRRPELLMQEGYQR